jgi:hypothetical protein
VEIKETKDYSRFKFLPGNRIIDYAHVAQLKKSISHRNLISLSPVIVNDHFYIIDKQHTFLALKELDLPIMYVQEKGLGLEDVKLLNSTNHTWSGKDYLNLYVSKMNKNYIILDKFIDRWNFNLWEAIKLLLRGTNENKGTKKGRSRSDIFRSGDFVVNKDNDADTVAALIYDFSAYVPNNTTRSFIIAFLKLYDSGVYDHNRMKKQLALYNQRIPPALDWSEWVKRLEMVYNFQNKDKVNFKIHIKEKS